jgi:hypothetical protein
MKRLAALALLLPLAPCRAGDVGLMPSQKAPMVVSDKDRNPFGVHHEVAPETPEETESEESQIRKIVGKLPMSGFSQSPAGIKILLGSMIIEAGHEVPQVISNQTEILEVLSVSPQRVELGFKEKDGSDTLRKIVLFPDLSPKVRYKLESQSGAGAAELSAQKSTLGGVARKNEPPHPTQ